MARAGAWCAAAAARPIARRGAPRRGRALEVDGDVALDAPPLVVELRPRANIAAGEAEHSLGAVLAERLPGTSRRARRERRRARRGHARRRDVLVVRDAHRHPWMRDAVERLAPTRSSSSSACRSGARRARGYAATHGGSRVSYEVLADRLLEPSEVRA